MRGTVASKLNSAITTHLSDLLLQVPLALPKMVNFSRLSTLPLVALGVLTSQVSAAPVAGEAAEVTTTFSFAEWVDSIIADPSTALSPKEAVQAYLDTANATFPATAGVEKRGWDAQVVCRSGKSRAPVSLNHPFATQAFLQVLTRCIYLQVSSAAFAINFLAAAGQVACPGRMVENGIWPQRIWINWNGALLLPFDHDNDPRNYPTWYVMTARLSSFRSSVQEALLTKLSPNTARDLPRCTGLSWTHAPRLTGWLGAQGRKTSRVLSMAAFLATLPTHSKRRSTVDHVFFSFEGVVWFWDTYLLRRLFNIAFSSVPSAFRRKVWMHVGSFLPHQ